jgi:hypothetical protein
MQCHARPRSGGAHSGVLLARDEAQRECGEGDAQRKSPQCVIRHTPDGSTHRANGILTRVLRNRLCHRGDAPLSARGQQRRGDGARIRPAAAGGRHAGPRRREPDLRKLQVRRFVLNAHQV